MRSLQPRMDPAIAAPSSSVEPAASTSSSYTPVSTLSPTATRIGTARRLVTQHSRRVLFKGDALVLREHARCRARSFRPLVEEWCRASEPAEPPAKQL